MTLEEVSDTLSGGEHMSSSIGSSSRTRMLKFFARMGGMRVEFIVHTNCSYLNYMYERDVSHDEYEVKRIFESGVAELLFPKDIYEIDIAERKEDLLCSASGSRSSVEWLSPEWLPATTGAWSEVREEIRKEVDFTSPEIGVPSRSHSDISQIPPDILEAVLDPRIQQVVRAIAKVFLRGDSRVDRDRP